MRRYWHGRSLAMGDFVHNIRNALDEQGVPCQAGGVSADAEAGNVLIGQGLAAQVGYPGMGGSLPEPLSQGQHSPFLAAGQDLDPSICKVAGIAGHAQRERLLAGGASEPDPLNAA